MFIGSRINNRCSYTDLLAGKRIALFAGSGSGSIGTSERDAAMLVPNVTFEESLLLRSGTLGNMGTRIPAWLEKMVANCEEGQKEDVAEI